MFYWRRVFTNSLIFLIATIASTPTFSQGYSYGEQRQSSIVGKSMTVNVEPGQKINIHLLPEDSLVNLTGITFEVVQKPAIGKILLTGRVIGVVSYQASEGAWAQDSFQFVIKDKNGVPSRPATITILPQKADVGATIIAENVEAKFISPQSLSSFAPLVQFALKAQPTVIKLNVKPSSADHENLSFKIVQPPKYGDISLEQKGGVVRYVRKQQSDSPDSFTYSVVNETNGTHSKPGTVTLNAYKVEEIRTLIGPNKGLLGGGFN